MAGVPVPPRNIELMLIRLQVEQQQQLGAAVAAAVLLRRRHQRKERRKRRRRQCWMRPWMERRSFYGSYANLMRELKRESQGDFTTYMSMEPRMFHELLQRLAPRLTKMYTHYRRALEPGLKLAVTLRYMATRNSYRTIGRKVVRLIVRSVIGCHE